MGAVCFCLVALSVMAILGFLLKYQSNTKRMEWNDGWSVSVKWWRVAERKGIAGLQVCESLQG